MNTHSPTLPQWRVTIRPAEGVIEAHANVRLAATLRPLIAQQLRTQPRQRRFVLPVSPLHEAEVVLVSGEPTPKALGSFDLAAVAPPRRAKASEGTELPLQFLPDPALIELGKELVGLEKPLADIEIDLACRYDGRLDAWSAKTGCTVPVALRRVLESGVAVYLLEGPPGTGKTSLAKVILDARCRALNTSGQLLLLNTKARGNGLVGNFSQNIHAAFEQLKALPEGTVRGLLIDEVEAIAVRRSRDQTHVEDVAACSSLLQALDDLQGESGVVVFLTTNQASAIDPALRRRCAATFLFERPGAEARYLLLLQWVNGFSAEDLLSAVQSSEGMTPADINAALMSVFRATVIAGKPIVPKTVCAALTSWHRTEEV
jgi:hypothetical protein